MTIRAISEKPVRAPDNVYITGNHKSLSNWDNPGLKLVRISDTVWENTFTFNQGDQLEFFLNLGSLATGMAVDTTGWATSFPGFTVTHDTIFTVRVVNWARYVHERNIRLSHFIRSSGGPLTLHNWGGRFFMRNWRYHVGDNPEWAKPQFNDSLWQIGASDFYWSEFEKINWKNTGWFRARLHVDSALWNKTVGMNIQHMGRIDIYFNGRLITSSDETSTPRWTYIPFRKNSWQEFTFDSKADQLIAVRYENPDAEVQRSQGYDSGFVILLMGLNQAFNTADDIWSYRLFQVVFTIVPLVLSFMHLCLYFFYRRQRENLFYAICLLGFAGLTYFNYERLMLPNVYILVGGQSLLLVLPQSINVLFASTAIFFGTLTLFSISYGRLPKRWRLYLLLYIAVSAVGFLRVPPIQYAPWSWGVYIVGLQFIFMLAEGVLAVFRRNRIKRKGTWIILTGFIALSISIVLQLMKDFEFINLPVLQPVYGYGMLAFAVAMSLYLSYNFAFTNKDLEQQLVKVKDLSDKAVEQERVQARLEIESRLMEADDLRKTKELESARDLQLSLLPKQVPQLGNLEIACYMKTAAEVGGDYYDFHQSEDGSLTAVVGDATGHGLKAGNMVILAKGLFKTLAMEDDLLEIIHSFNRTIKQMDLYMLTMCMSLIRIKDSSLEYVSAGMPPMQIYRKEKGEIEELLLKGMPLGAFNDFPYKKINAPLCRGDVLLIMSDGLHEMFNEKKETYGMDRVVESFKECADMSAQEIIDHIYRTSRHWAHDTPLEDDMTVMVIRVK